MQKSMEYKIACTNCGESNYHAESNISFITGVPGFDVCHSCGYYARQFPKMAKVEIDFIKKSFSTHPKHFFTKKENNSGLYFTVLFLLAVLFSVIYFLRIY